MLFVSGEAPAKAVAGTGATEKVRHVVTENISQDECTITQGPLIYIRSKLCVKFVLCLSK